MTKTAETAAPIHQLLANRWSPRAFSDRPLEKEKLVSLMEAARWAPSCYNEQPWSFIVTTREEPGDYDRLLNCLVDANKRWARSAPVLVMSVAKLHFDHNNTANRYAFHDVGLAVATLIVQGAVLGIYVHQMAGFDRERARVDLGIPDSHKPVAAIALGYLGDGNRLPQDLREREQAPRERKELSDFVYGGVWENGASFLP
ncbi:MAG: nitroreductase family protein [bacterium]|nr:nitroreductase family protein [bacterium]